jgi:ABC-2 type transport system ATP-binding protein
MDETWVIETDDLSKRYGAVSAVDRLSLVVPRRQITAFLGRNGAGKSTTIKMLLGIIRPSGGRGTVLGRRIDDAKESREMRRHVAYVGEDKGLYAYFTVEEMIRFNRSFYCDWRPDVERLLLERYELPRSRKVKALSKGMRTKLSLLLAFSRRPELMILDEPSDGLDPVSIEELLQSIVTAAGEGTTIFFSSHQIAEVERIADRVCIIDRGRLAIEFSLDQMRQHFRRVTAAFNDPPATAEFALPSVANVTARGRQVTMVVNGDADDLVRRARELEAVSVDVAPVSLREVFLEIAKEQRT